MTKELADYTFEEIEEGMRFTSSYVISEAVYQNFLATFHDTNPLHVEEGYAKQNGFDGTVMHGAILNGFLSHFIGVRFPGKRALWLSSSVYFLNPSYLGDSLSLIAEVSQKTELGQLVTLKFWFENETRKTKVGKGTIQVKVRDV